MPQLRPTGRLTPLIVMPCAVATPALAQTGTVNVQGLSSHALPMLATPILIALAICLALTAAFKLRRPGLLATLILAAVITVTATNAPRLTAAIGLEITPTSPACSGGDRLLQL